MDLDATMTADSGTFPAGGGGFSHEALLYSGGDDFLTGTLPFIREAVAREDPVMVAVGPEKIEALRARLDGSADRVQFVDMHAQGANPTGIISLWHEFVDERAAAGRRLWGIGEPVWPERSAAELGECHRHECLLNMAFADTPNFRLMCPYDVAALDPHVIEHAHVSHPLVMRDGAMRGSDRYAALADLERLLGEPLPEPAGAVEEIRFDRAALPAVRRFAVRHGRDAGLSDSRIEDLVLAINELATNSACHGGGRGTLRYWRDGDTTVWEVRDRGRIADPLAGRRRPDGSGRGGFGLWLVNRLSPLVQVRSSEGGTVVRMHLSR